MRYILHKTRLVVSLILLSIGVALAIQSDGQTKSLNLNITATAADPVIVGREFEMDITLTNALDSEGDAYNPGFYLKLPAGVSYVSGGLGSPIRTLYLSGGETVYFFEVDDIIVAGSSKSFHIALDSEVDVPLFTATDIQVGAYAEDSIYGRGDVPTGAPATASPGGVDFAGITGDAQIDFPRSVMTGDIADLPFASTTSTQFVPYDIQKTEPGEMLIGNTYLTKIRIIGNDMGPLNDLVITDVIPHNRKFMGMTQTNGVGLVDVLYDTPGSGQVTLKMNDVDVATGQTLDIEYQTLAMAYDIAEYSGGNAILKTGAYIEHQTPSSNTVTLLGTGSRTDTSGNQNPITTLTDTTTPSLMYATLSKSLSAPGRSSTDRIDAVMGETIRYTINIQTADNVSYASGSTITDVIPDGLLLSGASVTTSGYPFLSMTSNSTDNEGITTAMFTITSGSTAPGVPLSISYDVLVDGQFEGTNGEDYENTEEITNTATFSGIITESTLTGDRGSYDTALEGSGIVYTDTATIVAPVPEAEKYILSITLPDGTPVTDTNTALPPGTVVEFALVMEFPNVHTTDAVLKDYLPLIMGPNTEIHEIKFVGSGVQDISSSGVVAFNDGDGDGNPDTSFTNDSGVLNLTNTGSWITPEAPNTVVFDLGEFTGARTFAIRFKTEVRPIKPSGYAGQTVLPQKNVALGSFKDDQDNTHVLPMESVLFNLAAPSLTIDKSVQANSNISYGDAASYTITLHNSGTSIAYVDPIIDTLPEGMQLSGDISAVYSGSTGPDLGYTWITDDNIITITGSTTGPYQRTPIGLDDPNTTEDESTIILTYDAVATQDFVIDQNEKTNTVVAEYYASEVATGTVNRYGKIEANASLGATQPSMTRTIISTSETGSVGSGLLIGEEVTFETIITLPGGIYLTGSFTDDLHLHLEFLSGTVIAYSGSLSFSSGTVFSGNSVDFGTITNTATTGSQTIIIHTTARTVIGANPANGKKAKGVFRFSGFGIERNTPVVIIKPNLILKKTASPEEAVAGTGITYTITVTNTGSSPAYDIILTDVLPYGLDDVADTLSGAGAWSGGQSELFGDGIILGELGTGGSQKIEYQTITSDDVRAGSTLTNTGSIVYSTLDDDNSPYEWTGSVIARDTVTISDFGITHQVVETSYTGTLGTGVATIGEIVTYDIYIAVPQVNATGVVLTQSLPEGVEFLSGRVREDNVASSEGSPNTILAGTGITFDFGPISNTGTNAGTGLTLRTTLRVLDNNINVRGSIRPSSITLKYDENNTKNHGSIDVEIQEPHLLIDKSFAVHSGTAGDNIQTTITVTNTGSSPAHNISIEDLLPSKTQAGVGYSQSTGLSLLAPGETWTWTYGTELLSGVSFGETLYGTGIIQQYESLPTGATDRTDVRVYTGGSDRDYIQILGGTGVIKSLTDPSETQKTIADTIGYSITFPVINGVTPSLVVTDTLPEGLVYKTGTTQIERSSSVSGVSSVEPDMNDQTLTRDFGEVVNSDTGDDIESVKITFDTIVTNTATNNIGNMKTNQVSVDYASGSQILTGLSPQVEIVEPSVGLAISSSYDYGTEIVYTFTLNNTGSSTTYDIQIPTVLSGGLTYVPSTLSGDGVLLSGDTFALSSLAPDETLSFEIHAAISPSVADTTVLGLAAQVFYSSQPGSHTGERTGVVGDPVNDYVTSDRVTTQVKLPLLDERLIVDKTVDDIGEIFTYTLTLINTGSVYLTGIDVSIPLSEYLTEWFSNDLTLSGNHYISTGQTLSIGETKTYIFNGTAKLTTPDQTQITTIATVSDTPQGAKGGTPSATITIRAPVLTSEITQTDTNSGQLKAGETLSNTATIGNTGSMTGTYIDVIITLSPHEEFVLGSVTVGPGSSIDPTKKYYNPTTHTVHYTIPALAPGVTEVVHFDTKVRDGTPTGTVIQPTLQATPQKGIQISDDANQLIVRNSVTGGSGGGPTTSRDDCPDGDYSGSRYDGSCGAKPEKDPEPEDEVDPEIFNPSFGDHECHNIMDETTIYQGNPVSEKFRTAHQMLYSYELTRWRGTADFAPERRLSRQEAARFMVEFAINVLCRKPSYTYTNQFNDIADADPTLLPYIKQSYEYKIFHGDGGGASEGRSTTFRPYDLISYDELVAVMVRLVTNEYNETGGADWADQYKSFMRSRIEKSTRPDNYRANVAETVYDLYRLNTYHREDIGFVIDAEY